MIPNCREFIRQFSRSKIPLIPFYYAVVCLVPIVSIFFTGNILSELLLTALYFLGFLIVGIFLLILYARNTKPPYIIIFLLLIASVAQIPGIHNLGFTFGDFTARYDILITVNLIGLLTEKKVSVGLNKKSYLMDVRNFLTIMLLGISGLFVVSEFSGTLGNFSLKNIQHLEFSLFLYQTFFYLVVLMCVAKYLFYEGMERLLGDFPVFVCILGASVLIFLFMFFSIANSREILIYIISFSLLLSGFLWSQFPPIILWVICSTLVFASSALFEFKLIPGI